MEESFVHFMGENTVEGTAEILHKIKAEGIVGILFAASKDGAPAPILAFPSHRIIHMSINDAEKLLGSFQRTIDRAKAYAKANESH